MVLLRGLPKNILRSIENELRYITRSHPEIAAELDESFQRIRTNVLDFINDAVREIENSNAD